MNLLGNYIFAAFRKFSTAIKYSNYTVAQSTRLQGFVILTTVPAYSDTPRIIDSGM